MDPAHPAWFRVSPAGLESKILCIFMYVYLCSHVYLCIIGKSDE